MWLRLFKLQWKSLWRSRSFRSGLWFRVAMVFAGLYMLGIFLFMGVGIYFILKKEGFADPFSELNKYLLYYLGLDLVFRFMLQKMPVTQIKPLLTLPVRRRAIVNFSLSKTMYSFYNWSHLFLLGPLAGVLIGQGYDIPGVLGWLVAIMGWVYLNNFVNILANKNDWVFYPSLAVFASVFAAQYYGLFDIRPQSQGLFDGIYERPALSALSVLGAYLGYVFAFGFFRSRLYLDGFLRVRTSSVRPQNLSYLDRFGELGLFLKNDIRMITRNKRPRTTVLMAGIFLLYGLLFFPGAIEVYQGPYWGIFGALFTTGGFTFTFGQYIPSWDSSYYPFMMTQNIPYRTYLNSKWWLIFIATSISILLSLPYVYFGMDALYAIISAGIFNLGVNSHMVIWGGAYVKTPLDLTATNKAFGDSKSFNAKTLILIIPKMLLPIGLYFLGTLLGSDTLGYVFVAGAGLLGFLFKGQVFNLVEQIYLDEKYATIKAYAEDK